jgi:hypothetical protein
MKRLSWVIFAIVIIFFGQFIIPVSADELVPTITHVFFEKDGNPYHGNVRFTMNCYGYRCGYYDCRQPTAQTTAGSSEIVFSFSASCPDYGCTIYEPFYLNYRQIESCDIVGVAEDTNFTIPDFSTTPIPNCSFLTPFQIRKANGEYYNGTPEYEKCINESYQDTDLCNRYLTECSPTRDKGCGNWMIDDTYMMDTPKSVACKEEAHKKREACDVFLEKVDPSSIVMWKDPNNRGEDPARRACELRFTIPSGNGSAVISDSMKRTPENAKPDFIRKSNVTYGASVPTTPDRIAPVESLYCGILNFFGARC